MNVPDKAMYVRTPIVIKLPFIKNDHRLGDVIKQATSRLNIKLCSPCEKRAQWLNEHVLIKRK